MSDDYIVEGQIIDIGEVQSFDSGFTKLQFVVKTDGDYPQEIALNLVKDRTNLIDRHELGDRVRAHFNLRGNPYKGRWFVDLNCWRIESPDGGAATDAPPDMTPEDVGGGTETADDLPF
jgi:hypothetical protein